VDWAEHTFAQGCKASEYQRNGKHSIGIGIGVFLLDFVARAIVRGGGGGKKSAVAKKRKRDDAATARVGNNKARAGMAAHAGKVARVARVANVAKVAKAGKLEHKLVPNHLAQQMVAELAPHLVRRMLRIDNESEANTCIQIWL
jgi:hypothetical protein